MRKWGGEGGRGKGKRRAVARRAASLMLPCHGHAGSSNWPPYWGVLRCCGVGKLPAGPVRWYSIQLIALAPLLLSPLLHWHVCFFFFPPPPLHPPTTGPHRLPFLCPPDAQTSMITPSSFNSFYTTRHSRIPAYHFFSSPPPSPVAFLSFFYFPVFLTDDTWSLLSNTFNFLKVHHTLALAPPSLVTHIHTHTHTYPPTLAHIPHISAPPWKLVLQSHSEQFPPLKLLLSLFGCMSII